MSIELVKLNFAFDTLPVLEDFSLELPPAGLVCLAGPSGCGKTSLLFVLAGLRRPSSGLIHGLELQRISLLFQEDRLLPWLTAAENVALVLPSGRAEEARPWLEMVELTAEAEQLPRDLSGGMRRRVALARALAYVGDILLLDEPTNGLDVNTLRALEDAIDSFAGVSLVISHDRWFLDRIATHILAFEDREPVWFDGNWSEYAEWRREKLGAQVDRPHRHVYRKLER
jgi:ATPase subunit of ABC transporter with duplicated ATPase domains